MQFDMDTVRFDDVDAATHETFDASSSVGEEHPLELDSSGSVSGLGEGSEYSLSVSDSLDHLPMNNSYDYQARQDDISAPQAALKSSEKDRNADRVDRDAMNLLQRIKRMNGTQGNDSSDHDLESDGSAVPDASKGFQQNTKFEVNDYRAEIMRLRNLLIDEKEKFKDLVC